MAPADVGDGGWAGFGSVIGAADLRIRARTREIVERCAPWRRVAAGSDDTPMFSRRSCPVCFPARFAPGRSGVLTPSRRSRTRQTVTQTPATMPRYPALSPVNPQRSPLTRTKGKARSTSITSNGPLLRLHQFAPPRTIPAALATQAHPSGPIATEPGPCLPIGFNHSNHLHISSDHLNRTYRA
jgi:hypothetical protein